MRTYTEDEVAIIKEKVWNEGERAALVRQLSGALLHLGYEERTKINLILEREQAIVALRTACNRLGDNDWDEDYHLADIINKHIYL